MPLSNYKVELKLKLTKYCVLSTAGNDIVNDNDSNSVFLLLNTHNYMYQL